MTPHIRVLLAEDDLFTQRSVTSYFAQTDDIELVGVADNGEQAVALTSVVHPDVALVDIHMPGMDGIETTMILTGAPHHVKVVCFTALANDETLERALDAGATGFLSKADSPALMIHGVRCAHRGDALVSPKLVSGLLRRMAGSRPVPRPPLSDSDALLLRHIGEGMSNAEIARATNFAPTTVKTYISRLLTRLECPNRTALARRAYQWGLVPDA